MQAAWQIRMVGWARGKARRGVRWMDVWECPLGQAASLLMGPVKGWQLVVYRLGWGERGRCVMGQSGKMCVVMWGGKLGQDG